MSRKLIRPTLPSRGATSQGRTGGRRPLPPEATNAEASYLTQAIESGALFVVTLLNGDEIRGTLEYYDRDCLKIEPEGGARLLLRKDKIRHYRAEPRPVAGTPEGA